MACKSFVFMSLRSNLILSTDQKVWGSNPYGCTIPNMFSRKGFTICKRRFFTEAPFWYQGLAQPTDFHPVMEFEELHGRCWIPSPNLCHTTLDLRVDDRCPGCVGYGWAG